MNYLIKNKSNAKSIADWAFFFDMTSCLTVGTAIKDNLQVKFIPNFFRKKNLMILLKKKDLMQNNIVRKILQATQNHIVRAF
jgi:hypothetical protein